MKKLFITLMVLVCAVTVWAASPHWVWTKVAFTNNSITVCFKEAGLGNTTVTDYEVTAIADSVYNCVNKGGNCPQAENKTLTTAISEIGSFTSTKNGNVTACLTADVAIDPETVLECPPGQKSTLTSVSYSGVVVKDLTNGISASFDADYSKVLYECNH